MNDIKELLEKYYNGETSLEEERRIREYFRQRPEENATPDALLSEAISAVRQEENAPSGKSRHLIFRYFALGGTALAAGLALLVALRQPVPLQQPVPPQQQPAPQTIGSEILLAPKLSGEIQDEQQALEQARKALAFVSSKLNKGVAGMNHLNKLEQSISKIQNKEKS